MSKKINIKNVAGFHSLERGLEDLDLAERLRRGLGIREVQKEGEVMLWIDEDGRVKR
jgi:hypothetical protein